MKKIYAILMMTATLAACVRENLPETIGEPVAPENLKTYTLTVQAAKQADATKALSVSGHTLNATWAVGDKVTVYNVTKSASVSGFLEAQTSGASTRLEGTLTGSIAPGDVLELSFLGANYTGQEGTLEYIAANCDYAVATVTVDTVDGSNNITTTAGASFTNEQTIVKFAFTDGTNPINVSNLTISAASNRLIKGKFHSIPGTYHTGYTATAGSKADGSEGHASLVDGDNSTKWCQSAGPWNITFQTAGAVWVDGYTLVTANDNAEYINRNPKNWVLKGKLNESDPWVTIAQVINDTTMPDTNYTSVDFSADKPGSYQYFYFEITATRGAAVMQLSEMKLWKGTDAVSTDYGPLVITPASASNVLTVALHNESGAADTYKLSAVADGWFYSFEKAGIAFEKGKYYEIRVPMQQLLPYSASNITVLDGRTGYNSDGGENAIRYLFDGDKDTKWCSYRNDANTYAQRVEWQNGVKDQVIWKVGSSLELVGYTLTTGSDTATYPDRNWKSWTLYGGNFAADKDASILADGWALIQRITNDTVLQAADKADFVYTIPENGTAYKYYRLVIDDIQSTTDNIQQMAEMTLFLK